MKEREKTRKRIEWLCNFIWKKVCEMEDLIDQTAEDGYERGFSVCMDPATDEPYTTSPCKGGECSVTLPRCPPKYMLEVGSFHTHPGGSGFSAGDLLNNIRRKSLIACLGYRLGRVNHIECESLSPAALDRYPKRKLEVEKLLEKAADIGDRLTHCVLSGKKDCEELWYEYEDKLKEAKAILRRTRHTKTCRVPELFGAWERTIEKEY